jgi:hypothetical protein
MSNFQPLSQKVDKAQANQFYTVIVQNIPGAHNKIDSNLKGFLDAANAILASRFIEGR